jgi:hypothetical protein
MHIVHSFYLIFGRMGELMMLEQDECAQYMLYGLLDTEPARGVFIRGQLGDVVSSHVFTGHEVQFDATSPTANKTVRFPPSLPVLVVRIRFRSVLTLY